MKKTLCKTLHDADKGMFICIEDIHKVYLGNCRVFIQLKNIDLRSLKNGDIWSHDSIYIPDGDKCKELYENIIKELEEYYGTNNDR